MDTPPLARVILVALACCRLTLNQGVVVTRLRVRHSGLKTFEYPSRAKRPVPRVHAIPNIAQDTGQRCDPNHGNVYHASFDSKRHWQSVALRFRLPGSLALKR